MQLQAIDFEKLRNCRNDLVAWTSAGPQRNRNRSGVVYTRSILLEQSTPTSLQVADLDAWMAFGTNGNRARDSGDQLGRSGDIADRMAV